MNNIFTFEEDDEQIREQQSVQIDDQSRDQSSISHMNKKKQQKQQNFQEFLQFDSNSQKEGNEKQQTPLKARDNNRCEPRTSFGIKKEKFQLPDPKKYEHKNNDKNQNILSGLQVEDLGTKDMEYVSEKKALKVTDMRKFLHTPLGEYKVKAIIRKEGGNIFNLGTRFHVFIQQNNRYIFSVSREGIAQYNFSLDKTNYSQKRKSYLGKMVSNMAGTEFLLFDNGFSPKQTRQLQSCRKQLASIKYQTSSGPRKFTVVVSTNCQGFYCLEPQQNILEQKWDRKQRDYLSILYSKTPELDPEDGNYKLDFKGIVKKASVKNFILGGKQWDDSLIFGKIDNDTFIMEIKQPLGVFQAAAISISSIHYKLHWK